MSKSNSTDSKSYAKTKSPRLGRGLSSLMAQPTQVVVSPAAPEALSVNIAAVADLPAMPDQIVINQEQDGAIVRLAVETISPNPHQPRQHFDPASLQGLADSIRQAGLMQPILVRKRSNAAGYELIAGERRWRAAQLAGLTHVPAIVRQLNEQQLAEWALIENLQREDLNPIERALAFKHLIERFTLNHEQIAQQVGVERSTISNAMRLLTLHADIQQMVVDGRVSAGQAKALAGVVDPKKQLELAKMILAHDWSVRRVELAVRELADETPRPAIEPKAPRSAHLKDLEQQLGQHLKTKVKVRSGRKKGTGTLTIEFYSLDEFDALLGKLGFESV